MTGDLVEYAGEQKLQRIGIEEHDEQQDEIQRRGDGVVQAVTAEEIVMLPPDLREERETNGEGNEAAHVGQQFRESVRHFKRDDQQRQREAEDYVAEGLDTRDLVAAVAKLRSLGLSAGLSDIGSTSDRRSFLKPLYCIASATTGEGVSVANSPSHFAITTAARQLPSTLTAVRPMSSS